MLKVELIKNLQEKVSKVYVQKGKKVCETTIKRKTFWW